MTSELRGRAVRCQAVGAAARRCAPDLLRPHGRAGASSRRPGAARSRPQPGYHGRLPRVTGPPLIWWITWHPRGGLTGR